MIAIIAPVIALEQVMEVRGQDLVACHVHPGGQGVHVARILQAFGEDCTLAAFNGGELAPVMRALLDHYGVRHHLVEVPLSTAAVVTVRRDAGTPEVWQQPCPPVSPHDADTLLALATALVLESRAVVLIGTLTQGMPASFFAQLVRAARCHGVPTVVDLDPQFMDQPLAAGPTIVKPNLDQLQALVPLGPSPSEEELRRAAAGLRERGAQVVVVTLGAEGAVAVAPEGTWRIWPPLMDVEDTAGTGDSMVALLALGLAQGWPLEYTLRAGTAAGAAKAVRHDLGVCQPDVAWRLLRRVRMERVAA